VCLHICENIDSYTDFGPDDPAVGGANLEEMRASELISTGMVYIYHETRLTPLERGELDEAFRAKGLRLQLRSTGYALERQGNEDAKRNRP
jgi:hypothetical protein